MSRSSFKISGNFINQDIIRCAMVSLPKRKDFVQSREICHIILQQNE